MLFEDFSFANIIYITYKSISRGVAQPGSASGLGPEGRRFKSCRPDQFFLFMKKRAKIYMPTKTAMQSGLKKTRNWVLEFITKDNSINPLMGWESSVDTLSEVKLEFSTKELAVNYAKKNDIDFQIIEPKKRKLVKKSYSDNFTKT